VGEVCEGVVSYPSVEITIIAIVRGHPKPIKYASRQRLEHRIDPPRSPEGLIHPILGPADGRGSEPLQATWRVVAYTHPTV